MLAGVLVVAFPVSVFSDLWSEELKKVKGFDDLLNDDDDEDDGDNDDRDGDRRIEKEAEQPVNDESRHNKILLRMLIPIHALIQFVGDFIQTTQKQMLN